MLIYIPIAHVLYTLLRAPIFFFVNYDIFLLLTKYSEIRLIIPKKKRKRLLYNIQYIYVYRVGCIERARGFNICCFYRVKRGSRRAQLPGLILGPARIKCQRVYGLPYAHAYI